MTGQAPLELIEPELPGAAAHVWLWFLELGAARGSTGFGPAPLSYRDIADWSRLMHIEPSAWEVTLLRDLDRAFFAVAVADPPPATGG